MTNDDEGEGGVTIPPKIDDVIYEQPLMMTIMVMIMIMMKTMMRKMRAQERVCGSRC